MDAFTILRYELCKEKFMSVLRYCYRPSVHNMKNTVLGVQWWISECHCMIYVHSGITCYIHSESYTWSCWWWMTIIMQIHLFRLLYCCSIYIYISLCLQQTNQKFIFIFNFIQRSVLKSLSIFMSMYKFKNVILSNIKTTFFIASKITKYTCNKLSFDFLIH